MTEHRDLRETPNLRQTLKRLAGPVDKRGVWASLQSRVVVAETDQKRRAARRMRLVGVGFAAILLVAGIAVGAYEGVEHPRGSRPDLAFVDAGDTTVKAGQTAEPNVDDGWTRLPLTYDGGMVDCLALSQTEPSTLFAAVTSAGGGRVFKSTDKAGNWKQVLLAGDSVNSLGVDPAASGTVYVVANDTSGVTHTLWRTLDGGATWTNLSSRVELDGGDGGFSSSEPAFDTRTKPSTVYVCGATGWWRSSDNGNTWQKADDAEIAKVYESRPAPTSTPTSLPLRTVTDGATGQTGFVTGTGPVTDPTDPSLQYIATMNGVFKSVNAGKSWSSASRGITCTEVDSMVVGSGNPASLYAATPLGIFKSTDGGDTWAKVLGGGAGSDDSGGWWSSGSVVVAPTSPATVYARTSLGLFRSDDGGENWTELPGTGLPSNGALDGVNSPVSFVSAADPRIVFISWRGEAGWALYRSADGGNTWSRVTEGLAELVQDPADPSTIYAVLAQGNGLCKSTDAGATWASMPLAAGWKGGLTDLAVDPNPPSAIYMVQQTLGPDASATVLRSADGGNTWAAAGMQTGNWYYRLLFPHFGPLDPSGTVSPTVYATTWRATAGPSEGAILRSHDGGASWTDISGRLRNQIVTLVEDPGTPGALYAVTGAGIYRWSPGKD